MNKADTAQIAKIALDAVSFSRQHQEPDRRGGMGRFEVPGVALWVPIVCWACELRRYAKVSLRPKFPL
jgi:hypothetical protein